MTRFLRIDLGPGWKETFSAFPDAEPFDADGERNYDVSENLYQAELRAKDGSNLILDIGFYQTEYRVVLVRNHDWTSPLIKHTAENRSDAKRVAEEISRRQTDFPT